MAEVERGITDIEIVMVGDKLEIEPVRFTKRHKWVQWCCAQPWEVVFDQYDNPFVGKPTSITGEGNQWNGARVDVNVGPRDRFKYTVKVGNTDVDPELIVDE